MTHPVSYSITIGGSLPGVQWPGCDVDHSLPPSAEVKNKWSFTSASPVCLNGMGKDNFTFACTYCRVLREHCSCAMIDSFQILSICRSTVTLPLLLKYEVVKVPKKKRLVERHLNPGDSECSLNIQVFKKIKREKY